MALMNSLISSWNFEHLTASVITENNYTIYDTKNSYNGKFSCYVEQDRLADIKKEDIKTFRRPNIDSLEASETIQTLEEDDPKISLINKPSSVHLVLENSMYQIISDEMMNMFSTINTYALAYMEPSEKYKDGYKKLEEFRHEFFSKVTNNPNLEKYIEFYKWLDSSLGYMLDQLKPESTNNFKGLKNTVESHILERNKYKHQLPLVVSSNNVYNSNISVIKRNTLARSSRSNANKGTQNSEKYVSDTIENVHNNLKNEQGINFEKNYEVIQTAGKILNNRGEKPNDSVFQTRFSSVDGNSDIYRDATGEYSVYNSLNLQAKRLRDEYNALQSVGLGIQGCTSDDDCGSFRDNGFVTRNVPWTDKNYYDTSSADYTKVPTEIVQFRKDTNIIFENNIKDYPDSTIIIEPPVEHNIPAKHNLLVSGGLQPIEIYSPYSAQKDTFSDRNLKREVSSSINFQQYLKHRGYDILNFGKTFYDYVLENSENFNVFRTEKLELIYPRTDLIGLSEVRKKVNYEEEKGDFRTNYTGTLIFSTNGNRRKQPWSNNSYNNNSSKTRMFWRELKINRRKTKGVESVSNTGSYNCLGFPNVKELYIIGATQGVPYGSPYRIDNYNGNPYDLIYSMDCHNKYSFYNKYIFSNNAEDLIAWSLEPYPKIYFTVDSESYGDLVPYSHFQQEMFLFYYDNNNKKLKNLGRPKPMFTHNIFAYLDDPTQPTFIINNSYQTGLDCRIKPFYDSYEDFRSNIKHYSQTYSIIPEFIVSNYNDLLSKPDSDPELYEIIRESVFISTYPKYLTINGTEKYDEIRPETFIADFKPFVNKKANKIKIKLKGVKKLLPYNGFYPQQRTAQIAGRFMDDYMTDTGLVSDADKISEDMHKRIDVNCKTLSTLQPLFMPGILFNTIKSGIGVSWPIKLVTTPKTGSIPNSAPQEYSPIYIPKVTEGDSDADYNNVYKIINNQNITVNDVNYKLPFETILEPYKNYSSSLAGVLSGIYDSSLNTINIGLQQRSIVYLDPTHYDSKINLKDDSSRILIYTSLDYILQKWKGDKIVYKSMINNFLAETVNFFIKNGTVCNFISKPARDIYVVSGATYSMSLILNKDDNFSMFNKYSDTGNGYISSASLFGPPVTTTDNNIKTDILKNDPYLPYTPSYFNGKAVQTVSYTAKHTGQASINEIINNLEFSSNSAETIEAFKKRMPIIDSINWKLQTITEQTTYDKVTGFSNPVDTNAENRSWVIQTKFECPLLNFNQCSYVETGSLTWEPNPPSDSRE